MKLFVFVLIVLSLTASGSAFAQDTRPSWFLMENDGDIFAVDAQSETVISITAELKEDATYPFWSTDGSLISFILTENLPTSRNQTPYGVAAWTDFNDGEFEINTVPRCEQSDVTCTNASISGGWMVFTAVRTRDGYPILYAYDITRGDLELLQSGGFYPDHVSNRWKDGQYIVVGQFDSTRQVARIFDIPGPGYETSYSTGVPGVGYLGCNLEAVMQVGRGSRQFVEVRFDQSFDTLEYEGRVGQGRVWRNCRASQPVFGN